MHKWLHGIRYTFGTTMVINLTLLILIKADFQLQMIAS